MTKFNPTSTPMEVGIKLSAYTDSPLVNESLYWQLVDSLIYLTTTQSDLCFVVLCLFLNSCLILKSYIGKLQNESVNIQRVLDFGILYQGSIDSMIAEHIDLNSLG